MTAAQECFLGVSVAETADAEALEHAYGTFRDEATALNADYEPESVNTDGWAATQQAWTRLFPSITVALCFW
ncbi:MAG: hypothetical protein VKL39_16230 [Leptolyngbyaceae bacterium]|nr:hypothetical protein [Leptolyngbyaceae bacterium]